MKIKDVYHIKEKIGSLLYFFIISIEILFYLLFQDILLSNNLAFAMGLAMGLSTPYIYITLMEGNRK